MFDWTDAEENSFYNANIENFAKMLKPLEDSSEEKGRFGKEKHQNLGVKVKVVA